MTRTETFFLFSEVKVLKLSCSCSAATTEMKTETEMLVKFFLRFQKVLNSIYTFFFEESVAEVIHDHRWLLLKEIYKRLLN